MKRAVFIGEGTSDTPLGQIVASLFDRLGVQVDVITPDFVRLPRVAKDVGARIRASLKLTDNPIDVFIIHRDADSRDCSSRRAEIARALKQIPEAQVHVPVVPIQATESWLLLDERQIRVVAGNPRGRMPLGLPDSSHVESRTEPKRILAQALLLASDSTGRRKDRVSKRFSEHRRTLLSRLDLDGPITQLSSFQRLLRDVEAAATEMARGVERQ